MHWALVFTAAVGLLANPAHSQTAGDTTSYVTSTVYAAASSSNPYTTSTSSSYYATTPSPTTFSTSSLSSSGWPAFPTVPYTGQSLLVGTCTLPQYTVLQFPDGGLLEVPLIGCSDDRPECCPGIVNSAPPVSSTAATESSSEGASTTSSAAAAPSLTPTGVISALSQNPLSVCPSDMLDLDPVCCPSGFKKYGQSIVGDVPCVSTITVTATTTVLAASTSVPSSIQSVVNSILATRNSSAAAATTSVTVVYNEVFALGLPCQDQGPESSSLSTGAKAGIGAGVGVAVILFILLLAWFILRHRKNKKMQAEEQARVAAQQVANDPKHVSTSTATTLLPTSPISHQGTFLPQQQPQPMHMYPQQGMYPMMQPHGFGPAFGYAQQQGYDPNMPPPQQYGFPHQQGMYPGGYVGYPGYPAPRSPPPPFHTGPEQKPVEVDGGVVHAPEPRSLASNVELSGSERGTTPGLTNSSVDGRRESNTTRS